MMTNTLSDRMTPKQRMAGFLQGQEVDRPPCAPLILNHAARISGVRISEYNQDGGTMGAAHVAAFKEYGHDFIFIFSTTSTLAEAMGTRLFFPDDDAPWVEEPVVRAAADLARVRTVDPQRDGRLPVYLEATRLCCDRIGEDVFVGCVFSGPFTTAAALRGTEDFIKETYKDPELVHKLLTLAMDNALIFVDAILATGGIPVLVEPVASGSLISPVMFKKFALPYLKPIVAKIRQACLPCILHICGKTARIVELMADTGANALSLDVIDLAEAKEKIGARVCLIGNVNPAETMLKGGPQDVDREARECLAKAGDNPAGFILSSGCEIPINTRPANIHAMIDAARSYRPQA
ncbi:MAG: uroporphyrinogen decarboxylase family protein [Desulfobacterales bacterium]|nr:uroporphyrinogen decarboxylase family protein [Desulfobacterales bacterium]